MAVPETFAPGGQVAFGGPDGRWWAAWVPAGAQPGQRFSIHLKGDEALQPCNVVVPRDKKSGERIPYVGLDGKSYSVIVPDGVSEGQSFAAWQTLVSVPAREQLDAEELRPWMQAARSFEMNTDFHVDLPPGELDFNTLMGKMKLESEGKPTIQALGDKILLSRMLANLGVPQMPVLLEVQADADIQQQVEQFVEERADSQDACKLFVKPSHLSNANGVLRLGATGSSEGYRPTSSEEKTKEVQRLTAHITKYMGERAAKNESLALQSLKPGILIQPQYESVIGFQWPLELRVVTIWGKARMGIWWWGYQGQPDVKSNRNTWFMRIPATRGKLRDDDRWDTVHSHVGTNPGFESAIKLLGRHMPAMAAMAEYVATMVGAPFLRVDFFVGSPRWGVRLNEVAYGSTIEFCRRSTQGKPGLVNDASSIAQIIQCGMAACKTQLPASRFLGRLGFTGQRYEDMSVSCCPSSVQIQQHRFRAHADPECVDFAVTSDLCRTHNSLEPDPARCGCKCGLEGFLDSFQAIEGAQSDVLGAISCLSTHGFTKPQQHHLQPGSKLYLWVKSYFLEAMEARQVSIEEAPRQVATEQCPIFAIQRIVYINNPQLLKLYRSQQVQCQAYKLKPMVGVRARAPKQPHDGNEFFLWHACSDVAASNICQQGFEPQPGRPQVRFAESAISADVHAKRNASGVRCQVLARVLVGKAKRMSRKKSAVGSVTAGGDEFIINHQYEALPLFRVYYKHARTCTCNCCRKGC